MTNEQLSEYIGDIDEELVENAKKKRPSRRNIILMWASVAACAMVAFTGIVYYRQLTPPTQTPLPAVESTPERETGEAPASNVPASGAVSETPRTEESEDACREHVFIESDIYYVEDGELKSRKVSHEEDAQILFALWKTENHIGDEVQLVEFDIEDNGTVEESDMGGAAVAIYTLGDTFILHMSVSDNLNPYFEKVGKDLLLSSLEKTMRDGFGMEVDEFDLTFVDRWEEKDDTTPKEKVHTPPSVTIKTESEVYYLEDGELKSRKMTHEADAESLFALWKAENHIGDEVRMVNVQIDDRLIEKSDEEGAASGLTILQDGFVLHIEVLNTLDPYCEEAGKDLLLSSLEKTMRGGYEMEFAGYDLTITDIWEE